MTPQTYAQIGAALFNKDWVYLMRDMLDIRRPVAEQIAIAAAHGRSYDMPPGIEKPLRKALEAKIAECQAGLEVLGQ